MGRNYGHDHRDKFELMLWGRGRLLYPDWNAQQYEPMEYGWTRNAWAHSTLVVDESNPKGGDFTERHDFNVDAKFLATSSREIYPDVAQAHSARRSAWPPGWPVALAHCGCSQPKSPRCGSALRGLRCYTTLEC